LYNVHAFEEPQWWTKAHGYLAFLPLFPDLSSPPLDPLLTIPKVAYDQQTSLLVPEQNKWHAFQNLQAKLVHAVNLLVFLSGAAAVRPAYPCARVDTKTYKGPGSRAELKNDLMAARSWFNIHMVWVSVICYCS
jgi:hypothetical protein